jgi:hypothetical protein
LLQVTVSLESYDHVIKTKHGVVVEPGTYIVANMCQVRAFIGSVGFGSGDGQILVFLIERGHTALLFEARVQIKSGTWPTEPCS